MMTANKATVAAPVTTLEALLAEREVLVRRQDEFNAKFRANPSLEDLLAELRDFAHAKWPQYNGYQRPFATWTLAKIRRKIEGKGGIAFEPGDVVLIEPEPPLHGFMRPTHLACFSIRLGWNVAVNRWDVERL